MTKEIIADAVKAMPNEFSINELIERLILAESFKNGRTQYEEGKAVSHEEMAQRLEKWLK